MQSRKGAKNPATSKGIGYQGVKRIQPVRTEQEGQIFDSKAEAKFYMLLRSLFTGYKIEHPYCCDAPGKARDWKIDFGITLTNRKGEAVYCSKLERIKNLLKGQDVETLPDKDSSILLIEFKGSVDFQEPGTAKSGKLARLDTNFVSRLNHFNLYAPWILDDLVCIGTGSGAVITYCKDLSYCVNPVVNTEFFTRVVKSILK